MNVRFSGCPFDVVWLPTKPTKRKPEVNGQVNLGLPFTRWRKLHEIKGWKTSWSTSTRGNCICLQCSQANLRLFIYLSIFHHWFQLQQVYNWTQVRWLPYVSYYGMSHLVFDSWTHQNFRLSKPDKSIGDNVRNVQASSWNKTVFFCLTFNIWKLFTLTTVLK